MKIKFREVTTLSKTLALITFILFPLVAFYLGIQYQKLVDCANRGLTNISAERR